MKKKIHLVYSKEHEEIAAAKHRPELIHKIVVPKSENPKNSLVPSDCQGTIQQVLDLCAIFLFSVNSSVLSPITRLRAVPSPGSFFKSIGVPSI